MQKSFQEELDTLHQQSLLRRLREIESSSGPQMSYHGGDLVNFSSNDYLGLAGELFLREAAKKAIDKFGVGAGASRLICGTLPPHTSLERKLAKFKNTEASLVFSTGYATALGTVSALMGKDDVIIMDKLSHASLIDGARLSGAVLRVFPHNNLDRLKTHLEWARQEYPAARVLVITESVFSMDGDRALLPEIVDIKDRFNALLLLDEAHAVGVIGTHGRGLAERLGLAGRVDIQMGTLGKALGTSGGYICGSRTLIDLLINRARSFIYSTAPAPALASAAEAAIDFLLSPQGETRRLKLWDNLKRLASGLPEGLTPQKLQSAIVPVTLGAEDAALAAYKFLFEAGFFVPAIRYPTVAKGAARLRITLSAAHTAAQIDALNQALSKIAKSRLVG